MSKREKGWGNKLDKMLRDLKSLEFVSKGAKKELLAESINVFSRHPLYARHSSSTENIAGSRQEYLPS